MVVVAAAAAAVAVAVAAVHSDVVVNVVVEVVA